MEVIQDLRDWSPIKQISLWAFHSLLMKLSNCFFCKKIMYLWRAQDLHLCKTTSDGWWTSNSGNSFAFRGHNLFCPSNWTSIVTISLSFITFLFYPNTCSPLAEEDLRDLLTSFHLLCSDPRVACTCSNFLRRCSQNWKWPSKILFLLCFFQKLKSTLPNEDSKRPVEDIRHRALNKT